MSIMKDKTETIFSAENSLTKEFVKGDFDALKYLEQQAYNISLNDFAAITALALKDYYDAYEIKTNDNEIEIVFPNGRVFGVSIVKKS